MKTLKQSIQELKENFDAALKKILTEQDLESARITFLGRKGKLSQLMTVMKTLPVEKKRTFGPAINQIKQECEQLLHQKKDELKNASFAQEELKKTNFDVTAYKPNTIASSLHVYTQFIQNIENIFISMGYEIADGPEVETDFYNFQALNVPPDHPARDMQDTFWLDVPGMLLRTQTSGIQVREMQKKGAPLALVAPGRVYRYEATDASHDSTFTQCEGLLVDKNISMSHLLATLQTFLQKIFKKDNVQIRVRPGYFPFVEPGIEVDFSCPFCESGCSVCKKTKWIELMGAGLVHPNVLKHGGIDPNEYSGFAFGFGIERLAMIYYGITDIRLFHSNSIDFLKQF